ncbi:MAG: prepilin-type N-terminal cleavage/methylation domain-containing protein [Gemmatimonadota bacterium]
MDQKGFTLVELMTALIILTVAILGIAASAGRLIQTAGSTELRALAVEAAGEKLQQIVLDPRYSALDSIYVGSETNLPGLTGFTRTTAIAHIEQAVGGPVKMDYKRVTVSVFGPLLADTIVRESVVGAP